MDSKRLKHIVRKAFQFVCYRQFPMKEENQPATPQRRITVPPILRKIEVKNMRNTNRNNIAKIIDRTAYTTIKNNLGGEHSLSLLTEGIMSPTQ